MLFTSIPYRVTVFAPTSEQSNIVESKLNVTAPQASLLPLSISAVVMLACPLASKYKLMFWASIVGLIVSITVTVAVVESVLLFTSVPYRVTVFAPISEQSNIVESKLNVTAPQASLLPLSISAVVMLACPLASKYKLMFCASIVGLIVSIATIVTESTSVNPLLSVTVSLYCPIDNPLIVDEFPALLQV